MGGANSNFEILNWAFQSIFRSWIASGGSKPDRLGELGGNLLPLFLINRLKGTIPRIPQPPGYVFQLFLVEKIVSVKKIQA